jgi:hypothetical protein
MAKFKLEKIDQDHARKIDTRDDVTVLDIAALKKQKTELEQEAARVSQELAKINEILTEFEKLP